MKPYQHAIILSSLILASCGALPSSSASTSSNGTRRLVSEMMNMIMDDSYSLHIEMEEFGEQLFNVQLPLVSVTQDILGFEEQFKYVVDLTNEATPTIYYQVDEEAWTSSIAQGYFVSYGLLSPLMFLDPQSVEDTWFVFNDNTNQYEIDSQYVSIMFENSILSGVEDLQVFMTNNNEIIIKIELYDDGVTTVWFTLTYFDIGQTQVRLPDNVQSLSGILLDEILQNSTNHTFDFYLTPENGSTEVIHFGSRANETFALNRLDGLAQPGQSTFDQLYYTEINGEFIEISLIDFDYQSRDLTEGEYEDALNEFYPLDVRLLTSSRLGQQPVEIPFYSGIFGYPINLDDAESMLNTPYGNDVTNMDVYVGLSNTHWSGYTVSVYFQFQLAGVVYQGSASFTTFDQVSFVNPPNDYGGKLSLETMIERLKVTNSYNLYQVIDENSSTTIIHDFWAYFDGDDALIQTVNSLGYYDYDYYFVEGNEYVKYSYQYNSGSFISSTILEEEYRQRVIDPQWINFEAFDFGEDLGQSSEDDVYPLVVGGWNDYLSDFLLATYTIETGEITLVSPYEQDPSLMVSFQAVHTLTGEPTTLTAYIQSIGLITFASPNNSENPDNHDGQPISYETFKSMYAEGIQSFYGTYFSYDDQSHLAAYFDFIIQENGLVYYDYLTGDAVQVDILETGIFKQTGNTYENNVGSSFINLDEYNELKASYNFVDFEMLYDLNLTEIEAGFYEIDADDFEGLFNLETVRDALTMMQAYVYFDENFIRFEIDVYDNVNERAEFIGLYYDYINMPLQLNEFYLY